MERKLWYAVICAAICASLSAMQVIAQDEVELPLSHEDAGVEVLVPETIFFKSTVGMGTYWEPFTDIFGDGTVAVIAGAYPEGQTSGFNAKVAFIGMDGSIQEFWAFYADNGQPYTGDFNEARKDGNPPRIATDRRPGGTRYMVGMESTPYMYNEFLSDNRWDQSFIYTGRQIGAVQLFNKTASGPQKITNVIDPVYGTGAFTGDQSNQMRFGGEIRFLSDGNVVVVVEDRNNVAFPFQAAVATIFNGETGEVIKEPFNGAADEASHSIWSNVAPFKGGFAIRTEGIVSLWNNDGTLRHGPIAQEEWTMVTDKGRGDDIRIAGSINGDFIYILGKNPDGDMVVSSLNCVTGEADREVVVNELNLWEFGNFGRGDLAVDSRGNICVSYVYRDKEQTSQEQVVARILDSNLEPVGGTFFAFQNFERWNDPDIQGFTSKEVNVSMDDNRIVIAANGVTLDPETNALTPPEHTFAIVLKNPFGATSVDNWEVH